MARNRIRGTKEMYLIADLRDERVIATATTEAAVLKEANYMADADGNWDGANSLVLAKVTCQLQIITRSEVVKSPGR